MRRYQDFRRKWARTSEGARIILMAQVAVAVILVAVILAALTGCAPQRNNVGAPVPVWAWCGPNPNDPYAQVKANTLAHKAGVDAVFGPCLAPDWSTYTTASPGSRYLDPEGYMRAVLINAKAGMKTVVYDVRIASGAPEQRQEALDFWAPVLPWIAAWDMGDEFDPSMSDWAILVERWNNVVDKVYPVTGIMPFTNNIGSTEVLDRALTDMPSMAYDLSYDAYDIEASYQLAEQFRSRVSNLTCAVNAIKHGPWFPTPLSVTQQMFDHREAGCTKILIFGGDIPDGAPDLSTPSLVTRTGKPTALDAAVMEGAS